LRCMRAAASCNASLEKKKVEERSRRDFSFFFVSILLPKGDPQIYLLCESAKESVWVC